MAESTVPPPAPAASPPPVRPTPRPELLKEIIRLEAKGRRVLAGEDSWTTLFQTFNTIYGGGSDPLDLSSSHMSHGGAEEGDASSQSGQPPPMTPAIKDLLPKVLHVNQALLHEVVAMRPPSPGTYSSFGDAAPSHISVLLLAARALYAYPALQRLFPKYAALPYMVCLAGGLHSPECLHALMALREATTAGPSRPLLAALTDAELAANRKHAFEAGLTKALQELVEAATQLAVTHPPKGAGSPVLQAPVRGAAPSSATATAATEEEAEASAPAAPAEERQPPQENEQEAAAATDEPAQSEHGGGKAKEGGVGESGGSPPGQEPAHAALPAEAQAEQQSTSAFPLTPVPDPLEAAVPTLRLLLDLLCSFLHARPGCTPVMEYDALRRLLLQHSVLLFELSRHPDLLLRHRAMVLCKALILDSSPLRAMALQHAAVSYGVLLWQLHIYVALSIAEEEREKEDLLQQSATSAALLAEPASPRPIVGAEGGQGSTALGAPVPDTRRRRPPHFGRLVGGPASAMPLERQVRETCKDLITLLCISNDLSYEVMARALPAGILCMRCASLREDDRRRMLLRPDLDLMMEQHLASLPQAAPGTATAPSSPGKASAAAPGVKVRDLWFGPAGAAEAAPHGGGISGLLLSPARSARGGRRESGAVRSSLPPGQNWRSVLEAITQDWKTPELVWSSETRRELAGGLEAEVAKLDFLRHEQMQTAWDVSGFEVAYPSYAGQLLVDGYFVTLLVDALRQQRGRGRAPASAPSQPQHAGAAASAAAAGTPSASVNSPGKRRRPGVGAGEGGEAASADALMMASGPKRPPPPLPPLAPSAGGVREASRLFFHLQDRAVVEEDPHWRVMCLRAMRLLLARYPPQLGALCPVRFVLAEIRRIVEWHRRHDGAPFPWGSVSSCPARPPPASPEAHEITSEDAVDERGQGTAAALGETGEMDLMTQPLLRELLLLLLTTLEAPQQAWAPLSELVREMIRQGGTAILMDLYWHAMSLLFQAGKDGATESQPSAAYQHQQHHHHHHHHHHHDDGSEVTVDCPEGDEGALEYMHFSLFAIVLRLFEAMARYTPAAVQALLAQPEALPRLVASFYVLAGHGPSAYANDDVAISCLIRLLDRCLAISPDVRPRMAEVGVAPYLLTASLNAQGRGLLLNEAVAFFKKHHRQGQGSWLSDFLPAQMIRLLTEEKPERAARIFNSAEPVRCPDLIWWREHRRVCFARALQAVEASVTQIAAAPDAWPQGGEPLVHSAPDGEGAEDPYADLSALPQVNGVYLEEFLAAAGPDAFVRPPASHDLLCQLLSPLSRLVKACRPAPPRTLSRTLSNSGDQPPPGLPCLLNLYPHERGLPPHPLAHALLLLRCVHRCVALWPPHPQVWESVGVSGLAATLDWALTFPASDHDDGDDTTRMRVLGEAVVILLKVILHPAAATSAGADSSSSMAAPRTGRDSPSLPAAASSVSGVNQAAAKYTSAANQMTVPCAQRFLQHGGLSLAYEVARMALNSLRPSTGPGAGAGAGKQHPTTPSPDAVVEEEEERSRTSLPPPEAKPRRDEPREQQPAATAAALSEAERAARAAALLRHRVVTSALLLALLVYKYAVKPHEASHERYRARDLVRLVLLSLLLEGDRGGAEDWLRRTHAGTAIVGLTLVEGLLGESSIRQALLDLGGLPILIRLLLAACMQAGSGGSRPFAGLRRVEAVTDVRVLVADLLEGDDEGLALCAGCFITSAPVAEQREQRAGACCLPLHQRLALKALDVLWGCTQVRPHDAHEMAAVAKAAEAALGQAFTRGLLALLKRDHDPGAFLATLFAEEGIRRPWLIWGPALLAELREWVAEEAEAVRGAARDRARWPLWSTQGFLKEDGVRGQYPANLGEELMVDGIYLGPILEGDTDLGGTARVAPLLESLEVSIQGSLNVLQHLSLGVLKSPAADGPASSLSAEAEAQAQAVEHELEGLRRAQEAQLEMKMDALDAIIRANPSFAWKRNRLLGNRPARPPGQPPVWRRAAGGNA